MAKQKHILPAFTVSLLLLSLNDETPIVSTPEPITLCSGSRIDQIIAVPFKPEQGPVHVRKNVYSLSDQEIESIRRGVKAMKDLDFSDPTSWTYQAAIHGTTRSENLPSWNSCHKGGDAFFFLAWHRMYVYFFERILRAKSGDPNLTLPYWDYQSNPVLHPAYRTNSATNYLYHTRNPSVNAGGSIDAVGSISKSFNNSMDKTNYYDFQSLLNGPHGAVHVAIGRDMSSTSTAGQDPAFWLHHTNIDRLWERWLGMCGGRANPTTDDQWITKTFTFYDENGDPHSMTGSQVVDVARQLNYRYESPADAPCSRTFQMAFTKYYKRRLIEFPDPVALDDKLLKISFIQSDSDSLREFIADEKKTKLNFTDKKSPDKFMIELTDVTIEDEPEGVIEIYLNLPTNSKPTPESKSFVGVLDLFTLNDHHEHADSAEKGEPLLVDASEAARKLGLKIADFSKAEISFFVRGNQLNGKEVATSTDIKVGDIALIVKTPVKQ